MTLSLSAIRERLNRSSAGEWRFDENGVLFAYTQRTMQPLVLVGKKGSLTLKGIDLDFIQHAKTDVLDLIEQKKRRIPLQNLPDLVGVRRSIHSPCCSMYFFIVSIVAPPVVKIM